INAAGISDSESMAIFEPTGAGSCGAPKSIKIARFSRILPRSTPRMALIVQKYGGTSVGSAERIKNVARRVAHWRARGHQVVVVVSAMSGETNRLIALAKEVQASPDPRELDVMVSTGEQVTIALLSMALMEVGVQARSYTGAQVKILTDSAHTKARILSIDEQNIRADLAAGRVVVVAGFQGVDESGNITTLG